MRKSRKYFQEKIKIDKRINKSTAYKIQAYNNMKIDELVEKNNNDEIYNPPSKSKLWIELAILNKTEIYKNYNKIINSKYTSNDNFFKMLEKSKANVELNRVVEAEVERISANLDYVNEVMRRYDVPHQKYRELVNQQKNKSLANRQNLIKEVAIKSNDLLVSEGLNIPTEYSYRNLDIVAESLLRQSQMKSKHEEINQINENYKNDGKNPIYTSKEWIWTGAGTTTRHASNDHQIRQVNEPFIITNDETLDIDELMYPSDPAGSPSNTYICYCEVEYLTD